MQPTVKYKMLDPRAKAPAYATPGAAAADLCAVLAIELPDANCVALLYARSGLAIKHGLTLPNCVGVIDSDYRGEVKVGLINLSGEAYTIQPGERVAQLCIAPVWQAAFLPAETLSDTSRGAGGFGSTGKT